MGQTLQTDAAFITCVGEDMLPTGNLLPVENGAFDFRIPRVIGDRVDADDDQIRLAGGYDHNYVLDGAGMKDAATLACPANGISMHIRTTKPGVQVYSGNHLRAPFARRGGVCLETQYYPNSPEYPHFPSPVLRRGECYTHRTEYRFITG